MDKPILTIAIAPRTIGLIAALLLAWLMVRTFPLLLALFLVALVLAAALAPLVLFFTRRGIPKGLAIGLVFAGIAAFLAILFLLIVPVILSQGQAFAANLPLYGDMLQAALRRLTELNQQYQLFPTLSQVGAQVGTWISERVAQWFQAGVSFTVAAIGIGFSLFLVFLTAFFLLLQGDELKHGFLRLFPFKHRSLIASQFEPVAERLGAYVRGQLLSMSALALMLSVGLSLIGLPYAWLLAILAGVLEIVPYLGSITGVLMASLVAMTISWHLVLLVWVVFAVANFIQGNILSPLIMARTVAIPPVLVIFALAIGSQLLGILGAILAVPMTAVLLVLIENLYVPWIQGATRSAVRKRSRRGASNG